MMDEQLIDEVAQHAVIYNRQKYYLNGSVNGQGAMSAANKYETKDEAWQNIAMKLRSDVETCKKRWKYLRERYVSQRKQGDPPVYEHLSRPYLEKMKFLDQHIQPRKSYRNVPNFLTSPHSANGSNYNDYNMDSKSNSSLKSMGHFGQHHPFQDQQHAMTALSTAAAAASALEGGDSRVKLEADQVFRDFAAAVASQQLQQISQTQMNHHHQAAAVAAAAAIAADPTQNYNEHYRDAASTALSAAVAGDGMHSTSSPSVKSPLSSPLGATQNGTNSAGHSSTSMMQPSTSTAGTNHNINSLANDQVGGGEANSGNGQVSNNHFNNHSNFNHCQQEDMDSANTTNYTKKPRVQLMNPDTSEPPQQPTNELSNRTVHNNQLTNGHHHQPYTKMDTSNNSQYGGEETDDDSDENSATLLQPQPLLNGEHHHSADNPFNNIPAASPAPSNASSNALQRSNSAAANGTQTPMFPSNADFLFQLYQQFPQQQSQMQQQQHQQFGKFQAPPTPVQRSSEHLLGELVTTELLKMTKERRKIAQKRILEILFFDD